jgi:curved DNA-binding protein CbpA
VGTILPGLGPSERVPLLNRELDLAGLGLQPEDYFVLTRVDGRTTLKQLLLISGFPEAKALAIVRHLHDLGAIYFEGDKRRGPVPEPAPEVESAPIAIDESLLAVAGVDLSDTQKRAILSKHASLHAVSFFSVLGVPRDFDRRALKEAYRRLSKEYHPDRFGRRALGPFKALLAEIFEVVLVAYETLGDPERRNAYVASLAGRPTTPPSVRPLISEAARERARAVYEEACHHQVVGELDKALPEFAQALAIDPQPRWLRRAAEAALKAQELRLAEEYAKRGTELDPHNAMAHRILAKVLRALGRVPEARRELELAVRLDPENAHLAAELRALTSNGPSGEGGGN